MHRSFCTLSLLTLKLLVATAHGQADHDTPERQFAALLQEYRSGSGGLRDARTDVQRTAAVERLASFASRFVELAARHPEDAVALTALRQAIQVVGSTDSAAQIVWETNQADFPAGSANDSAQRIVTLVLRHHLLSDELGPIIDRMRYGYRLEYDECLSTILQKNPHHELRALACLALGQFLHDRLRMLRLVEDRPELVDCYNIVFGKDYLPNLQRLGQAQLVERIETLFERAANEFGDVKFRNTTVGETAMVELYDIRHLSVGKVAPDIQGKDQDGERFSLSDYRGKVVLLYFWSEY